MKISYEAHALEEFFTYHPPVSQERKDAHKLVGELCLNACLDFSRSGSEGESERIYSDFRDRLMTMTRDVTCQKWMLKSFDDLLLAVRDGSIEGVLMHAQQLRMFANQGITIDERSTINEPKLS